MSKKSRKGRKKARQKGLQFHQENSKVHTFGGSTLPFKMPKECHNAHYVTVGGNKRVFICGINDLNAKARTEISKLDLFIGLDKLWNEHLPNAHNTDNKFVLDFQERLGKPIKNLLVYPIGDYSLDHHLSAKVLEVVKEGWTIGFGCIGGHGRAGWLLGCLIRSLEGLHGNELAKAVRERHCEESIEGYNQHNDLGIPYVSRSKYLTPAWAETSGTDNGPLRYARLDDSSVDSHEVKDNLNAEDAAALATKLFRDSKIVTPARSTCMTCNKPPAECKDCSTWDKGPKEEK